MGRDEEQQNHQGTSIDPLQLGEKDKANIKGAWRISEGRWKSSIGLGYCVLWVFCLFCSEIKVCKMKEKKLTELYT